MQPDPKPGLRRDFVRAVAFGAVAAPAALLADDKDKDKPKEKAPDKPKEEPKRSEVDARMDLVLQRFGHQLDEEARKAVRADIEAMVGRSERLRKLSVENGDNPFPVFTPYRAPIA